MSITDLVRSCGTTGALTTNGVRFSVTPNLKDAIEINGQRLGIFLEGACQLIQDELSTDVVDGISRGVPLYEVTGDDCSLIVRLHLTFGLIDGEVEEEPIATTFTGIALLAIQNVMKETLQISQTLSEFFSVYFESPVREENGHSAVELEYRFPYCKIPRTFFNSRMKPLIEAEFRRIRLLDHMKIHPIGDWSNIVQEIGTLIPFYRAPGLNGSPPMTFSEAYGIADEHGQAQTFNPLVEGFAPAQYSLFMQRPANADVLTRHDVEYWLPLFFSAHYWFQQCQVVQEEYHEVPQQLVATGGGYDIHSKAPNQMIHFLLPLLSVERARVQPYWLDVGSIIFSIYGEVSVEGFEMWMNFSNRANVPGMPEIPGRDRATCEYYWIQFSSGLGTTAGLTIRTIAAYARDDNPMGYDAWHKAWISKVSNEATTKVQEIVAELVYRMFWLEYVFTGAGKGRWYQFKRGGTCLRDSTDGIELRNDITDVVLQYYRDLLHRSNEAARMGAGDPIAQSENDGKTKSYSGIIRSLGTMAFKNAVMAFCKEKFHRPEAAALFDINPMTIAWTNVVTVADDHQVYVRAGKMEDFLTKCTMIPLRDYSWEHPLVKELISWIGKVFPDSDLLHYFLKSAASFLMGRNAERYFTVYSGVGANSKSMIIKLFIACFGDYAINFPVDMLAAKQPKGGGPNPELAQAKGAHVAFISEAESKNDLGAAAVKRITGGDHFFARMCNENGGKIKSTFKLIFMCNRIPKIEGFDQAVIDRFLYLPFLSIFCDDAPTDVVEQYAQKRFPKDEHFELKIDGLARAMAWVLVQYYPYYCSEGLKVPAIVKEHTAAYWEANDPYRTFIELRIEPAYLAAGVINSQSSIVSSEIYASLFLPWYKLEYAGSDIPSHADFKREMCEKRRLGPQDRQRWWGLQVKPIVSTAAVAQ